MRSSSRTVSRCLLCGFTEVTTDEVVDRGVVLLAECPRCQHRWTESPPAGAEPRLGAAQPARALPHAEVATAA